jgi:outer membrane protein OmpA-like peptidoglycan-associated protein
MGQMLRVVMVAGLVGVALSGCATRNWVRDVVAKRSGEIDQRVNTVDARTGQLEGRAGQQDQKIEKVEGRVTEESQRVDGRMKTLEGSVNETGETARAARSRADAAYTRADETDARLTRLWDKRRSRNVVESVQVQFGFNKSELDDRAQTALAAIVKDLRDNERLSVDLEGFTDPSGPRDYNVQLSQRRVDAVRRYLVEQGVPQPRIHGTGLGPLVKTGNPEPAAQKRRVTLHVMVDAD